MDDEWINKDVRVPEGAYLASSHETPGAERALLFDRASGANLGPAEVRDPMPGSDSESDQGLQVLVMLAAGAVGAGVTLVAVNAPKMKRGLDEKVLPAIKAKWAALKSRKSDKPAPETDDGPSETDTRPRLSVVKDDPAA